MSFFRAENISAAYDGSPVLSALSFHAEKNSITGILGANGSGKTTLLKAICGAVDHGGSFFLDGTGLKGLSPRRIASLCSYIPQRSGISIDISALDVVLMGFNPRLSLLQQPTSAMRARAEETLDQVGLGAKAQANYLELSEGQKQLCILARTLVSDAKLLLLDEPESALDFRYRHHVLDLLQKWVERDSRCALISMHDPQLALEYCDRILILNDGRIQSVLQPKTDEISCMEAALRSVYGEITIARCADRKGREHLVLLPGGGGRA